MFVLGAPAQSPSLAAAPGWGAKVVLMLGTNDTVLSEGAGPLIGGVDGHSLASSAAARSPLLRLDPSNSESSSTAAPSSHDLAAATDSAAVRHGVLLSPAGAPAKALGGGTPRIDAGALTL